MNMYMYSAHASFWTEIHTEGDVRTDLEQELNVKSYVLKLKSEGQRK